MFVARMNEGGENGGDFVVVVVVVVVGPCTPATIYSEEVVKKYPCGTLEVSPVGGPQGSRSDH